MQVIVEVEDPKAKKKTKQCEGEIMLDKNRNKQYLIRINSEQEEVIDPNAIDLQQVKTQKT